MMDSRRWALVLAVASLLESCAPGIKELSRTPSPDGAVEAILVERLTDATVSTPTEINVLKTGLEPTKATVAFRATHVAGLSLAWANNNELVVSAAHARMFREQTAIQASGRTVAIRYAIKEREE
jgi:hypothetical protein